MMYHDEHWWTLMSHRIWVAILLGHQLWKRGLFGFSLASSSAKRRSFFHVERATMNPFQTRPGFRTAGAWSKQPTSCDGRFLGENRGCGTWWYVAICRDMSQYVTMTWLSRKPLQQDPAGSVLQHATAEESERVWKIWDILRFAEHNWAWPFTMIWVQCFSLSHHVMASQTSSKPGWDTRWDTHSAAVSQWSTEHLNSN
jgi:hypothetical protein